MANAVYISQSGTGNGSSISTPAPVTYFNNASNWVTGTPTGQQIGPGTVVHLVGTITTTLTVQGSGVSGNPITIFFEPNAVMTSPHWPPNIDGALGNGAAIWSFAHDYIVVDGGTNGQINATNQNTASNPNNDGATVSDGVQFNYGSGIEIKNLTVLNIYVKQTQADPADFGGPGIQLYRCRSNCSIHNNVVAHAGACITTTRDSGSYSNCQIYNNTCSDANWGIQSGDPDGTAVLDNFQIYNNDITMPGTIWDDPNDNNHHNGMYIWANNAGATITNLKIYDNYIHGDPGAHTSGFIHVSANDVDPSDPHYGQGMNGTKIYNNILVATGQAAPTNGMISLSIDGFLVYNNTIVSIDIQGFGTDIYGGFSPPAGSGTFQNTIFANMMTDIYEGGGGVLHLTADHNVDLALTDFVNGSSTSTPQNFMLKASSTGRNAGVNLSSIFTFDYNGVTRPSGTAAWDVGALQFASVTPHFSLIVTSTSTVTALSFHGVPVVRHFPMAIVDTSSVTALAFRGATGAGGGTTFTVGPGTHGPNTGTYTGTNLTQITLPQSGTLKSISTWWVTGGSFVNFLLGLYDNSNPHILLASSAVGSAVAGLNTLPIASGPVLAPGTYNLALQVQSALDGYYDTPAGGFIAYDNGTPWTGALPNPFTPAATANNYQFSLYATFGPTILHFPFAIVDTSTVLALGYRFTLRFPITAASTSTVTALGFHGANVATFTLGYTTQGSGVASQPGIFASQATLTQPGTVLSISILSASATPDNIIMGVYADNGNIPGALLCSTAVVPTASVGWITAPVASSPLLSPGNYWLAIHPQNPFPGYYDTPVGASFWDTSVSYTGTLENPFPAGNGGGPYLFSMYANLAGPVIQHFPVQAFDTSTVLALGYHHTRHFPIAVSSTSTVITLGFDTVGAVQHFPINVTSTSTVLALGFRQNLRFPLLITDTSTVLALGMRVNRRFPITATSTSTVTALGYRVLRHFPLTVASTSTVIALGLEVSRHFPLIVASTSTVISLGWHETLLLHFPVSIHSTSTVTALGYEVQRSGFGFTVASTSTVTLGFHVGRRFQLQAASTSTVIRLYWSLPVQHFPIRVTDSSHVIALGFENDLHTPPPVPLIVPPYSGINQPGRIQTPAPITYREAEREEGPFVMPPYVSIFPEVPNEQIEETATVRVPPPVQTTDIFSAQQTFPL